MFSRLFFILCAFALVSNALAQDNLTIVEQPQKIKDEMVQRGAQEQAAPVLTIAVSKHSIKLELVAQKGNLVDNSGYSSTTDEITVVK